MGAMTIAVISGCTSDSSDAEKPIDTEATPATAKTTPKAPAPKKTYVPAPGDPKQHIFNVTIHDVKPLDAYMLGTNGECVTTNRSNLRDQLAFSGPSKLQENRLLESFDIPSTGRLLADGSCEATLTVTVRYRPRFEAGVAMEGNGIAEPGEPNFHKKIITKGNPQKLLILR